MNSPFVIEQAKALAARTSNADPANRVAQLYRLTFARKPTAEEVSVALAFVSSPAGTKTKLSPWEQLAQVLLASNEFAFVD